MAKPIKMPDGVTINFPDEMDDATIHSEGLKYMNGLQEKAAASGDVSAGTQQGTFDRKDVDTGIDIARPFVSNAAGGAAALAAAPTAPFTMGAGPFAARTGAYSVVDGLMQYLKEKKPDSPMAALGEGAKQSLINSGMQKIMRLGNAFHNASQPEILKYLPTSGQALKSEGHDVMGGIAKFLEDQFAPGSKGAALDASAEAIKKQGLGIAGRLAGRNPSTVAQPQQMVRLITGKLVPEESIGPSKILQRTADYQPIKITPKTDYQAEYTPIKVQERPVGRSNPLSGQTEVIPEGQTKLINYPQPGTTTQVTGPIEQVPIPGAYEILPGVIKRVPYATDPASLDALIGNESKLQEALTRSQKAGLGYNVREDLAGYNISRILHAATGEDGRVNAQTMKNLFNDPNMAGSNRILYSKADVSTISQFFKNAAEVQAKSGANGNLSRMMLRTDGVVLPFALVHSMVYGNPAAAAGAAGVVGVQLGGAALAKVLTNKNTARFMLRLANSEALGASDPFVGRVLVNALHGQTIGLIDAQGQQHPGVLGKDGKFVPIQQ